MNKLRSILKGQDPVQNGVFSVCTANDLVLKASMAHARAHGYTVVIEATANQINQFGGYTGMLPRDYVNMVEAIRKEVGLAPDQLILGGDHLGPLTWQNLPEKEAMANSVTLVQEFTKAGFTKIHLDTSMRVADDDQNAPLDVRVCARRGAILANAVKDAYEELKKTDPAAVRPTLVIGSEVPIPGGSQEHEDSITPTDPAEFCRQYEIFRETFAAYGAPFEDVAAFVVQPGVEFGDDFVFQYDAQRAALLCEALGLYSPLVFEGHSTDYQTRPSLAGMVRDGIRILKVGPGLTFALREALFQLEACEKVMVADSAARSGLEQTILDVMNADDKYWKKYYLGTPEEIAYKKLYSYSDRCRYYLPDGRIQKAVEKLLANTAAVPPALISQHFPRQYTKVMEGRLADGGLSLVLDRIGNVCDDYAAACGIDLT